MQINDFVFLIFMVCMYVCIYFIYNPYEGNCKSIISNTIRIHGLYVNTDQKNIQKELYACATNTKVKGNTTQFFLWCINCAKYFWQFLTRSINLHEVCKYDNWITQIWKLGNIIMKFVPKNSFAVIINLLSARSYNHVSQVRLNHLKVLVYRHLETKWGEIAGITLIDMVYMYVGLIWLCSSSMLYNKKEWVNMASITFHVLLENNVRIDWDSHVENHA